MEKQTLDTLTFLLYSGGTLASSAVIVTAEYYFLKKGVFPVIDAVEEYLYSRKNNKNQGLYDILRDNLFKKS